jgi:CDP-4-dehydro-6-deoxyglucose reductase/ferredoxin-NAD(P)+ reductase (naphthalene dioxygenase ferredoxin-specific)
MTLAVTVADLGQTAPAEEGQTVLDALLAHGIGFAYSCQAGNCGTCKCELVSGEVMELEYSEHALAPEERARGLVLACRSQVWSDVTVRRLEAEDFIVHPSRVMRCRVAEIAPLTHDILRLRLDVEAGGPFTFTAGQYAQLEFAVAPGAARDYSMANVPQEKRLEFHIRVMPGGSVSQRVAAVLKPGDAVRVSGPLGTSYLREKHPGPMVCVAGGSGLAPLKSIVEAALAAGFAQPIHFYFGVRAERDVYFEKELAGLQARHDNFRVHVVLSEPGPGVARPGLLPRRTGMVTAALAEDLPDLTGFKAYFAGPPPMVDAATSLARDRGVALRDIHADAFFPAPAEPSLAEAVR